MAKKQYILMSLNYKLFIANKNKGFIALTSVLIISAVIALLMLGIFRSSVGEMQRGGAKERSEEAFSLANLCMEIALNEIRKDSDGYGGNEVFDGFEKGQCKILEVERAGDIIVTTEGTAEIEGTYTRKIRVRISETSPIIQIASWQEIE